MGSTASVVPRIPVISLRGDALTEQGADWTSACRATRLALEEYGWFELVYDVVEPTEEVHGSVHGAMEELFSLPRETKMRNKSPRLAQGYSGKNSVLPNFEGLGLDGVTDKAACEAFTNLMWPQGNPHFSEVVHRYGLMMAEVQKLVVKMMVESYGISKDKEEAVANSTTYLLRLLRYERSPTVETNIGLKAHIDKSFITVLHQNHVHGLEVRSRDGQWIPYRPSSPSSFAVLAGDILMAWSNDRIQSCYHRSFIDGDETRYVVGLFTFVTGIIEAPEELVDEEHPLRYKPFLNQDFLDFYASSTVPDKNEANMVKLYCGI
ncbi:unnamed protein product [Linum tenue]|uniref:Fe2OG dioxygenase domain-containing protein n=1 Tax=Linum tenue TaxID=586396 RepID=A0AAV0GT87_9ROSI|nr:unnamed protein product [Linum tenue]